MCTNQKAESGHRLPLLYFDPPGYGSEIPYAKIIFNIRHILITLFSVIRLTFVQKDPPYTLIRGSNPYVFTWWKTYITELTTFGYDLPFSGKNRPPLHSVTRIRLLQSGSHQCGQHQIQQVMTPKMPVLQIQLTYPNKAINVTQKCNEALTHQLEQGVCLYRNT